MRSRSRSQTPPRRPGRWPHQLVPLLALCITGISACNDRAISGAHRAGADGGAAPMGLSAEQASRVLAKVGDSTITLGDYAATLERMDQFDRLRYQTAERRKELLDEIIDVELLAQDARARGLDRLPEVQEATRQVLRDAFLTEARKGLPAPADLSEQEVRDYYDAHRPEFTEPERRRASHIVLKTKDAAQHILGDARKATNAQWGELYMKHSLDAPKKLPPSQPLEMAGDLGIAGPPGDQRGDNSRLPAEAREALFSLKAIGDVADKPIHAADGWHIIRMTGKTDAHERTLAEADRTVRVSILQAKINEREKAIENDLRRKFTVSVDERALSSVEVPGAVEEGGDAGARRTAAGDGHP